MATPQAGIIFFDVHETLIYWSDRPDAIFARLLLEQGHERSKAAIEAAFQQASDALGAEQPAHGEDEDRFWTAFDRRVLRLLQIDESDELTQAMVAGFKETRWWRRFPDALPTLGALSDSGYRLGVIANAPHQVLERLRAFSLAAFFEAVTYSQEAGCEKPDRAIFELALARMGCEAAEATHVGDRLLEDVQGARSAGIRPILLDRQQRHPNPDCERITDLAGLLRLL